RRVARRAGQDRAGAAAVAVLAVEERRAEAHAVLQRRHRAGRLVRERVVHRLPAVEVLAGDRAEGRGHAAGLIDQQLHQRDDGLHVDADVRAGAAVLRRDLGAAPAEAAGAAGGALVPAGRAVGGAGPARAAVGSGVAVDVLRAALAADGALAGPLRAV